MARTGWIIVAAPLLLVLCAKLAPKETVPSRLPELYGTVEDAWVAQANDAVWVEFLIRCREPPPGVPESLHNQHERQFDAPHMIIGAGDATRVLARGGGEGRIAIGQTVSVWCSGEQAMSYPARWGAHFIVIEEEP